MSGVAAEQLAGLPGMPTSARRVHTRAATEGWRFTERPARGRNGTQRLYTIASLPPETRHALAANTIEATTQTNLTASQREAVTARIPFVEAVAEQLAKGARSVDMACAAVAASCPHSARTLRRWWDRVRGVPREEWAARLTPGWRKGKCEPSECHPEVWATLLSDYLREQGPALEACYRRTVDIAKHRGWQPVPSLRAMQRRVRREVSDDVLLRARGGRAAFEKSIPAQRRDHTSLAVLEAVNADGHRFDVSVRWPDGTVARPFLVGFQDIRTSKILSWRIDRTENIEPCRLAYADMVATHGVPSRAYIDNGRAWCSNSISGGCQHRYRRRIHAGDSSEEQVKGLFKACGTDPHFTKPFNGRAKPIERAWRDLCENIAKHPLFDGAYLGNAPHHRPENWSESKAIDLDTFLEVVAIEIARHNALEGRAKHSGRSFDAVFKELYEITPIRKLTEDQRRLLWLRSQPLKVRQDTTVRIFGATYGGGCLRNHRGHTIMLRLDPEHLDAGAYAYAASGDFLGFCHAIGAVPFTDVAAAAEAARAHRQVLRAAERETKALKKYSPAEIGRRHVASAGKPIEQLVASKVTAIMPGVARAPSAPRVTGPTDAEREATEVQSAAIIDIGRRSRSELASREDDVVLEIGRASFAALADQRR